MVAKGYTKSDKRDDHGKLPFTDNELQFCYHILPVCATMEIKMRQLPTSITTIIFLSLSLFFLSLIIFHLSLPFLFSL